MLGFQTQRLDVRPWTHDDVDAVFDMYARWEVARWLGAEPKVAESVEAMHVTVDRWAGAADGPYGIWAIVPRTLVAPVGTLLLVPLLDGAGANTGEVEVGWHLHPGRWGNGYATEAARGAVERAWAAELPAVFAVIYPGNRASVAVTQRLGMTPLGRTHRWYGAELDAFRIGRPVD